MVNVSKILFKEGFFFFSILLLQPNSFRFLYFNPTAHNHQSFNLPICLVLHVLGPILWRGIFIFYVIILISRPRGRSSLLKSLYRLPSVLIIEELVQFATIFQSYISSQPSFLAGVDYLFPHVLYHDEPQHKVAPLTQIWIFIA